MPDVTSEPFIASFLGKKQNLPLLKVPEDPAYVYPVSSFPPLSEFDLSFEYPSLTVPTREVAKLRKSIKSSILVRKKLRVIYELSEDDTVPNPNKKDPSNYRKIILKNRPNIYNDDEAIQALLNSSSTSEEEQEYCKSTHVLKVSYSDWTADEVLKRILPVDEVPSAFEVIGHLAHVNLRDELLPYKFIIGKVFLDKNTPSLKTIVNKLGSIDSKFRTFGMEVIAGNDEDGWSEVVVKEHGCKFFMDFRKVYWNSRLSSEHRRLVDTIVKDSKDRVDIVVADLMAGIGPFAVPLSKKGVPVYANDLNPESYKYLVMNRTKNKCKDLKCYNMDARAFCHYLQDEGIDFHHVLMNLPASAPEFLDAFRGFTGKTLPKIHVHCFGPKSLPAEDNSSQNDALIKRCSKALGLTLEKDEVTIHMVRDVAPKKNMYCVSFDLPEEARSLPRIQLQQQADDEPVPKRTKT